MDIVQCPKCKRDVKMFKSMLVQNCLVCGASVRRPPRPTKRQVEKDPLLDDDDDFDDDEDDEESSEDEDDDEDDDQPARRIRASLRWPLLGGFVWFFLGVACALLAPRFSLGPPALFALMGLAQLAVTLALIGWNLWVAAVLVARTGRFHFALPFSLTQLLLFPLLFLQVASFLGAHHYEMERAPTLLDWVIFSAAHAFRAADVADTLQAFGIQVQNIRHRSGLATLLIMLFHIVLDLFVLAFLLRAWQRVWHYLNQPVFGEEPRRRRVMPRGDDDEVVLDWQAVRLKVTKAWLGPFGAFLIVWLMSVLLFRNWPPHEFWLWPLENALRVIDLVDVMELWDLHISSVQGWWESVLAFLLRLLLAALLVGTLSAAFRAISIRWLHGFGLNEEDLEDIVRTTRDANVRKFATRRLEGLKLGHVDDVIAYNPSRWLTVEGWTAVAAAALIGFFAVLFLGRTERAAADLAEIAGQPDDPRYERALTGLRRLGPSAEVTLPKLAEALPKLPPAQQESVLRTIATMGPQALPVLVQWTGAPQLEVAQTALAGLGQPGPESALTLLTVMQSPHDSVRRTGLEMLRQTGPQGAQTILDGAGAPHAALAIKHLDDLDPNWRGRRTSNRFADTLETLYEKRQTMRSSTADAELLIVACRSLRELGPVASVVVDDLVAVLDRKDVKRGKGNNETLQGVRDACADALARIGPLAVPALLQHIPGKDAEKARWCLTALERMGPTAVTAVPQLQAASQKADAALAQRITECLRRIQPPESRKKAPTQ